MQALPSSKRDAAAAQCAFAQPACIAPASRGGGRACASKRRRHGAAAPRARAVRACAEPAAPAAPKTRTPSADPNEALDADALAAWAAIAELVAEIAPAVPADAAVAKAFGWGRLSQRFWRGDRVEELPSLERARASVDFLRAKPLAMTDADIATVLKKFPEFLNLDVEERMAANMDYLRKTYPVFKKDAMLKNAVLEQPSILGFSVDCGGDCMSECNRCWARF